MVKAQPPDAAARIVAYAKKHFPQLADDDGDGTPSIGTENPDPTRLYELLDTLVALRLEFAAWLTVKSERTGPSGLIPSRTTYSRRATCAPFQLEHS